MNSWTDSWKGEFNFQFWHYYIPPSKNDRNDQKDAEKSLFPTQKLTWGYESGFHGTTEQLSRLAIFLILASHALPLSSGRCPSKSIGWDRLGLAFYFSNTIDLAFNFSSFLKELHDCKNFILSSRVVRF